MISDPSDVIERRRAFGRALYGLHRALAGEAYVAGQARQKLARLRRSFAGPRQEAEAYAVVFPFDPPVTEQRTWLLLAGLFALHPHANTAPGRSMGTAMQKLAVDRGQSAQRRLEQLLSVDRQALPHYLRQAVTLLRAGEVAIDYHRLLADLLGLLHNPVTNPVTDELAHAVRLRWARDFYGPTDRPAQRVSPSEPTADPHSQETL